MRSELRDGGLQMHADISGSGETAVVLLHGLFGSGSNLMSLGRYLEPAYEVVRMDLRNHGKSAHRDTMDIPQMAEDLRVTLDALEIDQCCLFGHSLGGKVAMQFAIRHPQRCSKLVVADIAPVRYGRGHDAIIEALLALDLRSLRNREHADEQLREAVPEIAVRQFLLKNLARDGQGGWMWRMNLAAIADCYDNLRDAPDSDVYSGPTLFIRGGASRYIVDENRVPIMKQFPDCRLETIEDAGHWLHAEKPQQFNGLVGEFLAQA